MSIRVYLKNCEEVPLAATGYQIKHETNGGEPYVELSGLSEEIPESLRDFVVKVAFQGKFTKETTRRRGIYRHKGVVASLDTTTMDAVERYTIKVGGDKLSNILELYLKIRAGTVTPTEDWDATQTPAEMEEELERMRIQLAKAEANALTDSEELDRRGREILALNDCLSWWKEAAIDLAKNLKQHWFLSLKEHQAIRQVLKP